MPGILITGSHHAREHLSTDVPIRVAERFIKNNQEARIKALLETRDIYFLPMVNPDGAMWDIRAAIIKFGERICALLVEQLTELI